MEEGLRSTWIYLEGTLAAPSRMWGPGDAKVSVGTDDGSFESASGCGELLEVEQMSC